MSESCHHYQPRPLQELDLNEYDEADLACAIDDVIDDEAAYVVYDRAESAKPRAVMLPWKAYQLLVGRQPLPQEREDSIVAILSGRLPLISNAHDTVSRHTESLEET